MRPLLAVSLLLAAALAGCGEDPLHLVDCPDGRMAVTLWLAAGYTLVPEQPVTDAVLPGNSFAAGFATDSLQSWLSAPLDQTLLVDRAVTLDLWVRNRGSPAPIIVGGDPGEGYHFYNLLGSDATFLPAGVIEYGDAFPQPGSVDEYRQEFGVPPGGFVFEEGQSVRLLLTSLTLDAPDSGHDILTGPAHPSRLTFTARCTGLPDYEQVALDEEPVLLPGNHGLFVGAIPDREEFNQRRVPFTLDAETDRLTIRLAQGDDAVPGKDDMDFVVVDSQGDTVWAAGSPFADETAILWRGNLDALLPPGGYTVVVDSYSGNGYEGTLTILQESAT